MTQGDQISLSAESLQAVIGWLPAAVTMVDKHQRITAANDAAGTLFGYGLDEIVGGSLDALIPASARGFHAKATTAYMERPYVRHPHSGLQLVGVRKDGTEIPVDISLSTVDYPDGTRALAVVTNASDRAGRLEAEERTEHIVDFLSAVAHDLRTPLNSVLGFGELLSRQDFGPLNEQQARYVANIRSAGAHMLELLNDVLDLQAVTSGRIQLLWERVELDDVLEQVLVAAQPLARAKGLGVERGGAAGIVVVSDARRLRQIVGNLVSNAVKYTNEGRVAVTTRGGSRRVSIQVADTGPGIPEEELKRIFDPFVQGSMALRQSKSGSGLGLPLTKRLVQALKGELKLDSRVGSGTVATVALPKAAAST